MTLAAATEPPLQPLVSMRELEQLLRRDREHLRRIASRVGRYYRPFDCRREGKAKWRHIDNPTDELKLIQRRIYRNILTRIPLPATMLGCIPGRSVEKNAQPHCNQPALVTLDLYRCFPQTRDIVVFKVSRDVLKCSPAIAELLTKLTTFQHGLPQGAPSSSGLANLVLLPMHTRLLAIASEMGLVCTLFVDDIALSGARAFEAIEPAIQAIHRYGYLVRRSKIHLMPQNVRQSVTGMTVNGQRISIERGKREQIRQAILQLASRGHILDSELQALRGHIQHVSRFCPGYASRLTRLAERLLPMTGLDGHRTSLDEIRPCKGAKCHRYKHIIEQGVCCGGEVIRLDSAKVLNSRPIPDPQPTSNGADI